MSLAVFYHCRKNLHPDPFALAAGVHRHQKFGCFRPESMKPRVENIHRGRQCGGQTHDCQDHAQDDSGSWDPPSRFRLGCQLKNQPVVTCEATAASEPGEYDIIVSGAEASNYTINYVAGKLTVTVPASVDSLTKDIDATPTGIYTLGGARVNHSGNLKQLPKGVYVIQQGSKTFKYVNR